MTLAIQVALRAEADPLIDLFKLKPLSGSHLFPIWENASIKLIISGIGKIQAGAACSYLRAIHRDEVICGYLNIGIGGHRSYSVGTPFLIHTIIDDAQQITFFPSFAFAPPCQTTTCLTVDTSEHDYRSPHVYDMEAAGFYAIASKATPLEMIYILKIISDNRQENTSTVNKNKANKLILKQSSLIQKIVISMQHLTEEITPIQTPFLNACLKRWIFTTCETYKLKKLVQKWQILCPNQVFLSQDLMQQKTGSDALAFIENKLKKIPLQL